MTGKWQQQQQQGLNLLKTDEKFYPIQRVFFHPKKYHEKRIQNVCEHYVMQKKIGKQNENFVDFLHQALFSFSPFSSFFFHKKRWRKSTTKYFRWHTLFHFHVFFTIVKKKIKSMMFVMMMMIFTKFKCVPTICILFFGWKKSLRGHL